VSGTCYYFAPTGLANLVAYSKSDFSCTVVYKLESTAGRIPPGHTVIGMVERGSPLRPAVVAMDDSRTRIVAFYPGGGSDILLTTPVRISFAAASDAAPVVAFITETGELGVYSCSANAMVLQAAAEVTG
jgi:hypothetical protein